MRKRHVGLRRPVAALLSAALVVAAAPAEGGHFRQAEAAGSDSQKVEIIFEKEDGAPSKYGYQALKLVDASGRRVDEIKVRNEEYVSDGSAFSYFNEQSDTPLPASNVFSLDTTPAAGVKQENKYLKTEVEDQNPYGVCWAFAATAAMEANVVKKGSSEFPGISGLSATNIDFSERYLAWFAHNTFTTDKTNIAYGDGKKRNTPAKAYTGGNDQDVCGALAMGEGPEFEHQAPYSTSLKGLPESMRVSSLAQLHDLHIMGSYTYSAERLNTIKAMVANYGAVSISYNSVDGAYQEGADGRLSYYSGNTNSNHGVCIVGWDDNYSKDQFKNTPQGDGAWLVRNSWGKSWSQDGYFWMSYYEPLRQVSVYDMAGTEKYGKAYHYVRGYASASVGISKAANIFCTSGAETLNAVGLQTSGNGISATVTVYTKDTVMDSPVDGTLVATQSVEDLGLTGFHMIDLNTPVNLKAKQYFSVVVEVKSEDKTPGWHCVETNGQGKEKKGQTYYELGNSWVDATSKTCGGFRNAAIYAYTSPAEDAEKTAALADIKSQAQKLNEADVKNMSVNSETGATGDASTWDIIQKELFYAKEAKNQAEVNRAIRCLGTAISQASASGFYQDSQLTQGPGANGVELYANGGTVKVNGVSTNYKTRTLNIDIQRVNSIVKNKYKINGNYLAAVTKDFVRPEIGADRKLVSVDAEAAKIAKVKVSGSKITITPVSEGEVYVWGLWCVKSSVNQAAIQASQKDYAVTKVKVSTAPAAVRLYAAADADPVQAAVNYASTIIPPGGSTDVYVKGTIGSISKKANTMQVVNNPDIGYTASVPAKYADYVIVTKDAANAGQFHVKVSPDILTEKNVKDGKTLAVTVSFICNKNNKKGNLKLVIGNPVTSMGMASGDATTTVSTENNIANIVLPSAKTVKQTGVIKENVTLHDPGRKKTDGTSVVRIPCADGFTFSNSGTIKVVGTVSAAQKKVSLSAIKKQPGNYQITAAKGTPEGTEAYFVVYHNSYGRGNSGTGYHIVHVKVGEANHVAAMSVAAAQTESAANVSTTGGIATVTVQEAESAARTASITEALTLADAAKAGTDGTTIYRLPAADGYEITTAKEMKVVGKLSAEQKKITMAAVGNQPGTYKISLRKGTARGTEAWFVLFHNAETNTSGTGFQIIKVVAG